MSDLFSLASPEPSPELIHIEVNNGVATVNARDLHAFLEVGTSFKDWVTRRIADYGFIEGVDFSSFLSESSGGRPAKDYHLSLDMAKELSMVERNEKGKQARQYFLACERKAKSTATDPIAILSDPAAMRGLLLTYTEKVLTLEATVAEQKPKVAALDLIATADGSLCLQQAAKSLQSRPIDLIKFLSCDGWIYRRPGNGAWTGYSDKLHQGVLEHKVTTISVGGVERVETQVRVTAKGLAKLAEIKTEGGWR